MESTVKIYVTTRTLGNDFYSRSFLQQGACISIFLSRYLIKLD